MHFVAYVLIPNPVENETAEQLHGLVDRMMAPYSEHLDEFTEEDSDGFREVLERDYVSFGDFWSIGGRWTGYFGGYDPHQDPKNWEKCEFCDPLNPGIRTWPDGPKRCNGCTAFHDRFAPPGYRVKWPSAWLFHPGDVVPVKTAARFKRLPFTVLSQAGVYHRDGQKGELEHQKRVYALLDEHDGRVAVVDYHN